MVFIRYVLTIALGLYGLVRGHTYLQACAISRVLAYLKHAATSKTQHEQARLPKDHVPETPTCRWFPRLVSLDVSRRDMFYYDSIK